MTRIRVLMRGASTTPLLSLLLVVVIAVLSWAGIAAPGMLEAGRTATVQRAVSSVPALTRWPSATVPGMPAFGGADADAGVWRTALTALDRSRQEQPEPLRGLLGAPRLSMTIDPVPTSDDDPDRVGPVPFNKVGLVSDPGFLSRSQLVDGRLPKRTDPADGVEIALTNRIAAQLDWKVGTERKRDDLTLTLTGTVEPSGRDAGDWTFINGSLTPLIEVDGGGNRILVVAGFMHVDEITALTDRISDIKTSAWMPFEGTALDATTAAKAAAQLRRLAADPARIPMHDSPFYNGGLQFRSSLPQSIDAGVARADAMTPVVTVAAVGPAVVALVVLALVSRLIAVRRVPAAAVLRARGACLGRLAALLGGEGAFLGVLGAALGAVVAAIRPGWASGAVVVIPVALAAVPVVVLPWSVLTEAERRGRHDLGDAGRFRRVRLAAETLILITTGALTVLVMMRGGGGGADPLLLALLVLLGASGTVLSLRLLPALLGLAEIRGRSRVSLDALLGPARARRDPVVRAAPVLAVVVGVGVAVFSVAFGATVSGGIARAASIGVGADVRIDAAYIAESGAARVAELDGVAAMAGRGGGSTVEVSSGARHQQARVYTVDRKTFVKVQSGSDGALPLPPALTRTAGDAVPVVVSEKLAALLGAAEGTRLEIGGVPARIVGTAPSQAPFGTAEQWLIVDDANTEALDVQDTGLAQLFLSLRPGADADAVGAAAAAALGGDATSTTPAAVADIHEQDPGYTFVQGALLAASALVAVLLALAVVATLVLGAGSRARMLAILSTLGHRRRASGGLVLWEVGPALLVALPFGAGVGVATAWLVIPQLDLHGFVGGADQPPVLLGGWWPVLAVIAFSGLSALAVLVATGLASRLGAAEAIRADDERGQ